MRISAYVAISIDGFIARRDGSVDWLNEFSAGVPEGEDCGFQSFMDSVDMLVMGRKTFEQVLSFDSWTYGEKPITVLSSKPIDFPHGVPASVTQSSDSLPILLRRLSDEGVEHVYVDGGKTIQGFLSESLLDEVTITVIPIILGDGIPLFGNPRNDIHLKHIRTNVFDFGFVQSTYAVIK